MIEPYDPEFEKLLREEEVAGMARTHAAGISGATQLRDVLHQNHFNGFTHGPSVLPPPMAAIPARKRLA